VRQPLQEDAWFNCVKLGKWYCFVFKWFFCQARLRTLPQIGRTCTNLCIESLSIKINDIVSLRPAKSESVFHMIYNYRRKRQNKFSHCPVHTVRSLRGRTSIAILPKISIRLLFYRPTLRTDISHCKLPDHHVTGTLRWSKVKLHALYSHVLSVCIDWWMDLLTTCIHHSKLHYTVHWHTQISVLSLLQSPLAVSW
jgi:hypothetical protein